MTVRRKNRNPRGGAIAKMILEQYKPENKEEMQDALKDIFGPMFEAMLQGEMDEHLGYESNDYGSKQTANRRNGYTQNKVKTSYGEVPVSVPRDREASFEPQVIPKRTKDVSGMEDKILSMYAKGMSQRDIAETIDEIYGFEISHEMISKITDSVRKIINEDGSSDYYKVTVSNSSAQAFMSVDASVKLNFHPLDSGYFKDFITMVYGDENVDELYPDGISMVTSKTAGELDFIPYIDDLYETEEDPRKNVSETVCILYQ